MKAQCNNEKNLTFKRIWTRGPGSVVGTCSIKHFLVKAYSDSEISEHLFEVCCLSQVLESQWKSQSLTMFLCCFVSIYGIHFQTVTMSKGCGADLIKILVDQYLQFALRIIDFKG